MREYKFNDQIEQLKTKPEEVTITEFMNILINKEDDTIGNLEYYLNAFSILGFSEDLIDSLDVSTLFEIIKDFNDDFIIEEGTKEIKNIEIGGFTYSSGGDIFNLNARDLTLIEKQFTKPNWPLYAISIIFKRTDLTKKEHYTDAHIKHKMELFKNIKMDIAMPYVYYVADTYTKNIKLFINE